METNINATKYHFGSRIHFMNLTDRQTNTNQMNENVSCIIMKEFIFGDTEW